MNINPKGTIIANNLPNVFTTGVYLGLLAPSDWKEDWNPCNKCKANNINENTYSPTLTGL